MIEIVGINGCVGYNNKDSTFFTKQAAIDNWRYHSKAETSEHAKILNDIADELKLKSENLVKNLRQTKKWQDL